MTSTYNTRQRLLDCLRQWASAERDQDDDELCNARQERDEILEEHRGQPEHDGPRCWKCHKPTSYLDGSQLCYPCDDKWVCDSCAAALEREHDRKREERK